MTTTFDGPLAGHASRDHAARLKESDCRLEDLVRLVGQRTDLSSYPHAARVADNILVYDSGSVRAVAATGEGSEALSAELVRALMEGPRRGRPRECLPGP